MASRVQASGVSTANDTNTTRAYPSNVTVGNLLVIAVFKGDPSDDPFVVGDISKSAGSATLDAFTLDVDNNGGAASGFYPCAAIYSAPVTGTGSCTILVSGNAGTYWGLMVAEYSGMDVSATRVAGPNETATAAGVTDVATGTVASGGAGVFIGCLSAVHPSGTCTIDPDAAFSTLFEQEDAQTQMTGSMIERIVASNTTDEAQWTRTSGGTNAAVLAVYKDAAGAAPSPGSIVPTITM